MTIANYQYQYGTLVMGEGTSIDVISATGFDTLPAVNQNDVDKERDWGQYEGAYYTTGRELVLNIEISDPTRTDATFRALIESINAATIPSVSTEIPLLFFFPGMAAPRQCNARVISRDIPMDLGYTQYISQTGSIDFWCTDPRIYDSNLQYGTANAPGGGGIWPWTWPVDWVHGDPAGQFTATNSGNFETRGIATLTATSPLSNPGLANLTQGKGVYFAMTMAAGSTLVIDFNQKTVLYNGVNARQYMNNVTSKWWSVSPGVNNLQLTGGADNGAASVSFSFRNAWL
jgi:hypothetical protein